MNATKEVARYVKENGITIKSISERTGIPVGVLYPSLGSGRGRKLNADEFLIICDCLNVDPKMFQAKG